MTECLERVEELQESNRMWMAKVMELRDEIARLEALLAVSPPVDAGDLPTELPAEARW